jgi:hypothetical protein
VLFYQLSVWLDKYNKSAMKLQTRKERIQQVNNRIQNEWQSYFMKQIELIHQSVNDLQYFTEIISKHADLDFNYVTAHPEYNWSYNTFAMNPNLPLAFIIKNIDKFNTNPTNWDYIFYFNNNLTNDFLIELSEKHGIKLNIIKLSQRGFFTTQELQSKLIQNSGSYMEGKLLVNNYTFDEAFTLYLNMRDYLHKNLLPVSEDACSDAVSKLRYALCMRLDFDFTCLDKYINKPQLFNWDNLSRHPKLTLEIISKHIHHYPWRFRNSSIINQLEPYYKTNKPTCLSNHPCITIDFIRDHMNLNWCWNDLTKTIHPQLIKDNMDLPWLLNKMSENVKLTPEFVLRNKFFNWDYNVLMDRFYDNTEFVDYFIHVKKYLLQKEYIDSMQLPICQLLTTNKVIIKVDVFINHRYIIKYLKHKFVTQEYRKHVASYLIQQRWQAVYMSPYNSIGNKRLCREYDEYELSIREYAQHT